jgi:DNA-binding transcriptional LysR family regulator
MGLFREMEMFVRVVEAGSFSSAARDLKIGQPSISKTIAGLEDRLGDRLLVRSTRQLTPTEAGIAFYERALRAITETIEAEAAAKGAGPVLRGDYGSLLPLPSRASIWYQSLAHFLVCIQNYSWNL